MTNKAKATPVAGGRLCGRVRRQADVFLQNGYLCHCTVCRRSTGQPAEITVLIKAGTPRYVKGEPKCYQTSDSGRRGLCAECGSRLVWQAIDPADDWMTNVCVGSLDNPADARVTCHVYADTQRPWYDPCAHLPKFTEADADAMMRFIKLD